MRLKKRIKNRFNDLAIYIVVGSAALVYMRGNADDWTTWKRVRIVGKFRFVRPNGLRSILALVDVVGSSAVHLARTCDYDADRVRTTMENFRRRNNLEPLPSFRGRVHSAPGWRLHRLGSWLYAPRTFAEILEPTLSDMQVEVFAAINEGRPGKARFAQLRGYYTFWSHVALQFPISLLRVFLEVWRGLR